jgi:hypothetical protein
MKISLFLSGLLFAVNLFAQKSNFVIDDKLPLTFLTDTTQLTLLNARHGSRFSFSPVFGDAGIHTGALGYDMDAFSELLIEVETEKGSFCFRTAGLNAKTNYLTNQTMQFGMTGTQLSGTTPDGALKIICTIVSPFTPSDSLNDTENLKVQIAPHYYIYTEIFNLSGEEVSGNVKIGLQKILYEYGRGSAAPSWRFDGRVRNELYFKDEGTGEKTLLALVSLTPNKHQHIKKSGFNTLKTDFLLSPSAVFNDTLAYVTHHEGKMLYDKKYNMPLRFYYTKFWKDIKEVIAYTRSNAAQNISLSAKFEKILTRSAATPEQKWMTALAFHNDIANAFLLLDNKDRPRFYLLEGRFRHISTIDVAHETELNAIFAPWRLKLQLDTWLDYVSRKEVWTHDFENEWGNKQHKEGMSASEYGPFVEHDLGDFPFIAETSEYSFGPHMAVEENANYALLLYWYWKLTADDEFVKAQLGMVDVLLYSMSNRDTDNSGIADKGIGWSSYDVSDAIKRSPENVYLGVKQLFAYEVAAEMFEKLAIKGVNTGAMTDVKDVKDGEGAGFFEANQLSNEKLRAKQAAKYRAEAQKIAVSIKAAYKKYKYLPTSLDPSFKGWNQHAIVICEGLFLPTLSGYRSKLADELNPLFADTYQQAYQKSVTPYGIKLSSEEPATWFSKTMVADVISIYKFPFKTSTAKYAYDWNKNNADAYNDGAMSTTEKWNGFWYPRGISALGYIFADYKFTAEQRNAFLKELR